MRGVLGGAALALLLARTGMAQAPAPAQEAIYSRPFITATSGIAIGGYAESHLTYARTDGIGDGLSAEFRRFNLFVFSSAGPRVRFISELEFERGASEIALETALIDFVVTRSLVLRGGIILPPIGAFNVNHDSPRYEIIERPLVSTRIIPATLSEVGFGMHGRVRPAGMSFSYDVYLTNGLSDGVILNSEGRTSLARGKSEQQFEADNNGSPALSGRLAVQLARFGEVGVSYYGGAYNSYRVEGETVDEPNRVDLAALDVAGQLGPVQLRVEAARAAIGLPPSLAELFASRQHGVYVDAVLPVWHPKIRGLARPEVSLALRTEYVDLNVGRIARTGQSRGDDITAVTLGLAFRPVSGTVIRANYRREWARDLVGNPAQRSGSLQGGFALYF